MLITCIEIESFEIQFAVPLHTKDCTYCMMCTVITGTQALVAAAAAAVMEQSSTDSNTAAKETLDSEEVIEDLSVPDPEADSAHYMAILVESLNLLGKIPEAVKVCLYVYLFMCVCVCVRAYFTCLMSS